MGSSTAARVRALRKEAGLSQEQLAVKAGLTAKTVGNVERDNGFTPHPGTLLLLAIALGCDREYLSGEPTEAAA